MKKNITSLELNYIIKELNHLIGAKVDKIYSPEKKELIINFYISGKGKEMLRIVVPDFIYLTEHKQEYPQIPSNFCIFLRKKLDNTRLKQINQLGFERIVEFVFETKDADLRLIFELFSKGNIVLCKDDYTIIRPLEIQKWSKRTVKPNTKYEYPQKEVNFLNFEQKGLANLIGKSKKNIVKTLAIDLGLGGTYAEEICLLVEVDKNKTKVNDNDLKKLMKSSRILLNKKLKPCVVYENKKVVDIVPFELEFYKNLETKKSRTYNLALDSVLTRRLVKHETEQKISKHQKKINKLKKIIEIQEQHVKKLEKQSDEFTKNAELIYSNYKLIEDILNELNKATEKYSWDEIKEKLKDHKIIKKVNSKDKTIVVELK